MAKAYLGSAKSFIALGKKEEARNTLQEMINRADLKEKAETKEAQRLIATL
jgi:FimV-like protein